MIKITNLMRRAAIVSSVTGVLLIGATATAHASGPSAPAPVAASSTGTSSVVQADDPTIQSAAACTDQLGNWGYTVTARRAALCLAASLPFPGAGTRLSVCTAGMILTGVTATVSSIVCTAAVFA